MGRVERVGLVERGWSTGYKQKGCGGGGVGFLGSYEVDWGRARVNLFVFTLYIPLGFGEENSFFSASLPRWEGRFGWGELGYRS